MASGYLLLPGIEPGIAMNAEAKTTRAKTKGLWWKTVSIALFALLVSAIPIGLLVYKFVSASNKQLKETDARFRKITNSLDAETVRAWALKMNHKKASQEEIAQSMPKELHNLYDEPPEVAFDDSGLALNW